jgi:hypothetical protein
MIARIKRARCALSPMPSTKLLSILITSIGLVLLRVGQVGTDRRAYVERRITERCAVQAPESPVAAA